MAKIFLYLFPLDIHTMKFAIFLNYIYVTGARCTRSKPHSWPFEVIFSLVSFIDDSYVIKPSIKDDCHFLPRQDEAMLCVVLVYGIVASYRIWFLVEKCKFSELSNVFFVSLAMVTIWWKTKKGSFRLLRNPSVGWELFLSYNLGTRCYADAEITKKFSQRRRWHFNKLKTTRGKYFIRNLRRRCVFPKITANLHKWTTFLIRTTNERQTTAKWKNTSKMS